MDTANIGASAVVARLVDGRLLKGTTHDFAPHKPVFHLCVRDDPKAKALAIPIGSLKALFFVRSYDGNPKRVDDTDIEHAKGPGRKIVVTFGDGEVLSGLTTGYSKDKPGFFVIPVDAASNNSRVFVVAASVKKVAWAETPVPARS